MSFIGRIYKLISSHTNLVYYGSTSHSLSQRWSRHKSAYKQFLAGKGNKITSFELMKYDDAQIQLIEEVEFSSKQEMRDRERYFIEGEGKETRANKHLPGLSNNESCSNWRKKNPNYNREYNKRYSVENKQKRNDYLKDYHKTYKERHMNCTKNDMQIKNTEIS